MQVLIRFRKALLKVINSLIKKQKTQKNDDEDDDPYGLDPFNYPLF